VATILFSLILLVEPGAGGRPAAAGAPVSIDWRDFFASAGPRGVVFSERMKALEGRRVRVRGFPLRRENWIGGLFLTQLSYVESDPHGADAEVDLPFDAVGVVWKKVGRAEEKLPQADRVTVEGVLRLGNRRLGEQVVIVSLDDAVVSPASR
jgi:hypothetical protein